MDTLQTTQSKNEEIIWEGRYLVSAMAEEYKGHKDVRFSIFQDEMSEGEIQALLEPFGETNLYLASYVDMTFTNEQAEQIKKYLEANNPDVTVTINPASIPGKFMSVSVLPVGGPQDFYMFYKADGYALDYKILGYYDLRQHEQLQPVLSTS